MAKTTNRNEARREARATVEHSVEHRLARLLDTPVLPSVVPHLPPETLHQLIRSRGLDSCGGLVTSATPVQLTALLDLDLWHRPSLAGDEQFDVDRFGEWIEVLVDCGSAVAARTVAALDPDLVIAGLSRYLRVLDPGIFEPVAQSDDERMDRHEAMRQGGDGIECAVAGYIIRARRTDAWDAMIALLTALDAEHAAFLHVVMQGCRRQSNSAPESDGLDDLLREAEQHLHEVTLERERRRSQQGYATSADARAFLQMARGTTRGASGKTQIVSGSTSTTRNPIVTAYFRASDEAAEPSREPRRLRGYAIEGFSPPSHASDAPTSLDAVLDLLAEAGVVPERPRALLDSGDADPQAARLSRLRQLMAYVRDTDDAAFLARSRELAFLANVLLAGCSLQERPFTPQEASDAAAATCNLGLEYGLTRAAAPASGPPASWLVDHDLITAFEVGWSVLFHDVSLFVAAQLRSTLRDLHCVDRDITRGLVALQRALAKQCEVGTPWRARDAASVLSMLDMTAWISVLGLIDECPVLPAAMRAILDRRTTTVSPTAFEFISTAGQIADVGLFMQKLPELLADR